MLHRSKRSATEMRRRTVSINLQGILITEAYSRRLTVLEIRRTQTEFEQVLTNPRRTSEVDALIAQARMRFARAMYWLRAFFGPLLRTAETETEPRAWKKADMSYLPETRTSERLACRAQQSNHRGYQMMMKYEDVMRCRTKDSLKQVARRGVAHERAGQKKFRKRRIGTCRSVHDHTDRCESKAETDGDASHKSKS
ncbi:hypothetical protein OBBRIDRAFT_290288 [Obba rivulosa]|uniref:Uncharacterized protein n=1 Tax=Obba rivulosa TaxID=1052685 RepID=A0A8E2DPU0_9APHY|nr:hypothetical protein OBBRIDRAFT_290288 [Obba rivulosa]